KGSFLRSLPGALSGLVIAVLALVGLALIPVSPVVAACSATVTVFLTSGTSWTVPHNWDSTSNTIEAVGGGGGGGGPVYALASGAGGGGGAYAKISNLALTSGASVTYQVGAGGAAGSGTTPSSGGTGTDT